MKVRKISKFVEHIYSEKQQTISEPIKIIVVSAIIENPWTQKFVENMTAAAKQYALSLGNLLTSEFKTLIDPKIIEAYGKASIVGIDGEIEHGSALIHTLDFGNFFRNLVDGKTLLPAVEKRGLPGTYFDIPLKHIQDQTIRSHHQTVEISISDAPHPNEILVAIAGSTSGRPLARLEPLNFEEV